MEHIPRLFVNEPSTEVILGPVIQVGLEALKVSSFIFGVSGAVSLVNQTIWFLPKSYLYQDYNIATCYRNFSFFAVVNLVDLSVMISLSVFTARIYCKVCRILVCTC